jgi:Zn-dependent protease
MDALLQTIAVYFLPVVFAITVHEVAHGYVARYFGDTTAYLAGRISLNPIRHIDPIGTILVPLVVLGLSMSVGQTFMFGWAKPVPVNFANLRHPKQDMLWVAIAGPMTNFCMVFGWALVLKILVVTGSSSGDFAARMALAGIAVNISFMLLNLIPIPPLDGGRVAVSLLPPRLAWQYAKLERYGILILIVLLQLPLLRIILLPLFSAMYQLVRITFAFS